MLTAHSAPPILVRFGGMAQVPEDSFSDDPLVIHAPKHKRYEVSGSPGLCQGFGQSRRRWS